MSLSEGFFACQTSSREIVSYFKRKIHSSSPMRLYSKECASILSLMSIRNRGGEWEPLMLGIEPESCAVCSEGLYRNLTFLRGGWSRCSICDRFVHYSCLASGKVSFLKMRPRVCQTCRAEQNSPGRYSSTHSLPSAIGS